jgi:hypothetical protein
LFERGIDILNEKANSVALFELREPNIAELIPGGIDIEMFFIPVYGGSKSTFVTLLADASTLNVVVVLLL